MYTKLFNKSKSAKYYFLHDILLLTGHTLSSYQDDKFISFNITKINLTIDPLPREIISLSLQLIDNKLILLNKCILYIVFIAI